MYMHNTYNFLANIALQLNLDLSLILIIKYKFSIKKSFIKILIREIILGDQVASVGMKESVEEREI